MSMVKSTNDIAISCVCYVSGAASVSYLEVSWTVSKFIGISLIVSRFVLGNHWICLSVAVNFLGSSGLEELYIVSSASVEL